jgi:hypothetical protein
MGKYLVMCQIGGAGDPVIYRRGAVINVPGDMDTFSAELHAHAGNLRPVDGTPEPTVVAEAPVIHEPALVEEVLTEPLPATLVKPSKRKDAD